MGQADKKQGFSVFKLLLAAVIAGAILLILLQALEIVKPQDFGDSRVRMFLESKGYELDQETCLLMQEKQFACINGCILAVKEGLEDSAMCSNNCLWLYNVGNEGDLLFCEYNEEAFIEELE